MIQLPPIEKIQDIMDSSDTIAVVGLSPKPERPSNQVARYMLEAGYTIIPVNPGHREILGQQCYPDLLSMSQQVDIVNIFRRPEHVLPIVRDAIAIKARVVWMQEGIINQEAAELAQAKGLSVIMDRCIKIDHQQYVHSTQGK